jgi:hypothetical protein
MITKLIHNMKFLFRNEPSYIFVGPPSSGKTVYFTCAMDRLQRHLLNNPRIGWSLQENDGQTLDRQQNAISKMENSQWPDKTLDCQKLTYLASSRVGPAMLPIGRTNTRVLYHDYPGEVFSAAFGDEPGADNLWQAEADDFKKDLVTAKGIFVVIDTPALYEGKDNVYARRLFSLLQFIETQSRASRIGVIFTKKDLFATTPEFNPQAKFRELFVPQSIFLDRKKAKYFFVSAVANYVIDAHGNLVPPQNYKSSDSENLADPLAWALGIRL